MAVVTEIQRLKDVQLFSAFCLAPWGAAKSEVWESMTDFPFSNETSLDLITRLINGSWQLSESHRNWMEACLA